jgi:hypothetical protein
VCASTECVKITPGKVVCASPECVKITPGESCVCLYSMCEIASAQCLKRYNDLIWYAISCNLQLYKFQR